MLHRRFVGHILNPTLTAAPTFAGITTEPKGCLSVPGVGADLARPSLATVDGFDRNGVPQVSLTGASRPAQRLA
ncbi:hypothetical protein [Pilimelia columellifera]|uniref:Uncharacterized protein n=1 Tax=Pilimelia columellifera subsp. columellifera TaxID=706583 RepID=A0ABP6B050_9ACTN